MNHAFDDERINAVRGRAMRKTVWFAYLFTLIYTVAVVLIDTATNGLLVHVTVVDKRFILSGILLQVLTLIGGAVILLLGELGHLGASKDEMKAHKKNLFYTKGFYAFVYLFAFAYCVHVAVNLHYDGYGIYPNDGLPYGFFPALLLECGGLFLIFSLKSEKVMLNAAEIEGGGWRYYKSMFSNILKFGLLCAFFTVFALMLYILLSRDPFSLTSLGVLLAGLATWLVLSAEYFLLSVLERWSETAMAKGGLSLTTLITFLIVTVLSLCYFGLTVYLNYFKEFNSGAVVAFYSYVGLYLDRGILLFTALFIMYFFSETGSMIRSSRLGKALTVTILAKQCIDVLSMLATSIVGAKPFDSDWQMRCRDILLYTEFAVALAYALVMLCLLIPVIRELGEKKLLPRIPTAMMLFYTFAHMLMTFLSIYLQRRIFNTLHIGLSAVMLTFFGIYLFKFFRKMQSKS